MSRIRTWSMATILVGGLAGVVMSADGVQAENLTVAAAYSLKPAFQEIVPMFEREYGAKVQVIYGQSQALRRDIERGAPIDVFLPAAVEEVETLRKKGLTLDRGVQIYAQSSLVLVMSEISRAAAISVHDGLPDRAARIALGDPKTSSLGAVTARALAKLDPAYRNRLRVVHGQHGEDIVNMVHTGQADAGIVYRVDAINNGRVRIIDELSGYAPVQFGQALLWTCRNDSRRVADAFLDFMMSPRIQKLLVQYGFDNVPVRETTG